MIGFILIISLAVDLIKMKHDIEEQPFLLIHKSIDVQDSNGKHLVGLRSEFLEPNSVKFDYSDHSENVLKVELRKLPKKSSEAHLAPQPLDSMDDLKAFHDFSIRGGMVYPAHRWPKRLIRNSNRFLTPFKMVHT